MARPAETYRGARRNQARELGELGAGAFHRLSGSKWQQPFDDKLILQRPRLARGWDYAKGGREKFNSVRDQYLGAKKQYRHLMRGA